MIKIFSTVILITSLIYANTVSARTKLVTLPDRESVTIRLDHPQATLVQEERTLTLQKGINQIDFSWKGVHIDSDSIRLEILDHPGKTKLINVSYPPNAQALVWDIYSPEGQQEKIRISYLLANIDRVITYEANSNKEESLLKLNSFMVLRNFSGEAFNSADFHLDYGEGFTKSINNNETKRMHFFGMENLHIKKTLTFDAGVHSWEPAKQSDNVGLPVHYELNNSTDNKLGQHALWDGKMRLYQDDGRGSIIFLGEDMADFTPAGKSMKVYIGDSRDVVVTQRKTSEKQKNVRRNRKNQIILYDSEENMQIKIENFKDSETVLKIIEPMQGEWKITKSSHDYTRKDAHTLEFELKLSPKEKVTLTYDYIRENIRG